MIGRKRLFTESQLETITGKITAAAEALNGFSVRKVKEEMQKEIAASKGLNHVAVLTEFAELSDKSIKTYMQRMDVTQREGKIKPESRIEPFLNIRKKCELLSC